MFFIVIETKRPLYFIEIMWFPTTGTLHQLLSTNLYLNYKFLIDTLTAQIRKKKRTLIIYDPYVYRIAAQIQILNNNPDCKVTYQ